MQEMQWLFKNEKETSFKYSLEMCKVLYYIIAYIMK